MSVLKLKVFTFRFSDNIGGFNDEAMQAFIAFFKYDPPGGC